MSELIKEAIKEINHSYATIVDGELVYQRSAMLNMFRKGAEWQSGQSPWISVKERLPEFNMIVLTKGAYGHLICFLSTLGEWETGAYVDEERLGITHWMPIPEFNE